MCREQQLEQREQAVQDLHSQALAFKADLQSLADTMQGQAERQVTDATEEKQSLARQQARLDTLQVPIDRLPALTSCLQATACTCIVCPYP